MKLLHHRGVRSMALALGCAGASLFASFAVGPVAFASINPARSSPLQQTASQVQPATPLGTIPSSQAALYSEYSFYQPREYSQGAYYWSAYLRLWSTGQFVLWLRTEQTYPGGFGQCDQVQLYTSHGSRYRASTGRITFPGSAVYDVTDDCTPSNDLHRSGSNTLTWSYRFYRQSRTALEFGNRQYDYPFNDFVFFKCVPNTNCHRHYA
jgi:hypothetical protein